ncbi:MAG: (d)CMP kinase [Bdellovibrionaceae bacterium]|nr:(d)CMP kinase [Pseudobdellovibrionaceae bacterium]
MAKAPVIVTIDGPAASGKSSVSREIARKHGWKWVSTGAFYRGLAFVALKKQIELDDTQGLVDLCNSDEWSIELTPTKTEVVFQGVDVTDQINHEDVGSFASRISHHTNVRKALLAAQRNCAVGQIGLVAEGRDCGTVVFPEAPIKVYLTAKSENRALRRALEHGSDVQEIQTAQKIRDQQDSSRKTAPLQIPENALVIDTTELDLVGVVAAVDRHIQKIMTQL